VTPRSSELGSREEQYTLLNLSLCQLLLKKISKIGAIRCQILRLKCTKFDFRCGFAPDPAGGAYSAPLDPLAVFKGLLIKGGTEKGREGRGGERRGELPPPQLGSLDQLVLKIVEILPAVGARSVPLGERTYNTCARL